MLFFLACFIGQFEPFKGPEITVDAFIEICRESKAESFAERIAAAERAVPTKKDILRNPRLKATAAARQKDVDGLKKRAADPSHLPPPQLNLESLKAGNIGTPTYSDYNWDKVTLKVEQVFDKQSFLASYEKAVFVVRNVDTSELADDASFVMKDVWIVDGRLSYNTVGGSKRTVFTVSPWPNYAEFQAKVKALKNADTEPEAKKAKKPQPKPKK